MAFTVEEQRKIEILKDENIEKLKEELARLSEEKDQLFNDSIKPANELKNIEFEMEELAKRAEILKTKEEKTTDELKEESQIANEFRALAKKREEYSNIILEFNVKNNENLKRKKEIEEEISMRESQIKEMLNPSKKKISGELSTGKLINDIGNININKRNNEIISTSKKSVNALSRLYMNSEDKNLVVDDTLKEKIENTKLITITEEYVNESDNIYREFLKKIDEQKIVQQCIEEIENYENIKQEEEKILDDSIKLVGEEEQKEENNEINTSEKVNDSKQEVEEKNIDNIEIVDNKEPEQKIEENNEVNISEIVNDIKPEENNETVNTITDDEPQIEVPDNINVEVDSNIFGDSNSNEQENKPEVMDNIKYDRNKISVATPDRLKERVIPNFKNNEFNSLDYVVSQRDGKVINVVSKKDYLDAQKLGMNILSPVSDTMPKVDSQPSPSLSENVVNIFDVQPNNDLPKAM